MMRLQPLSIQGAHLVVSEPHEDERGSFLRLYDRAVLARAGLDAAVNQLSLSHNRYRGTLRGMHYQAAPHEETKLVRCIHGRIYDVVLDLRPQSPTAGQWEAIELDGTHTHGVYVPKGCAHGFLTLTDDAEVLYQISTAYEPSAAAGVRWDDPAFSIRWPVQPRVISERDLEFPDHSW